MSGGVVTITLEGQRELARAIRRMDPTRRAGLMRDWLLESAYLVQARAQNDEIIRGGRQAPHPSRLTSRTGTGRRSIAVDRTGIPRYVEVGPEGVGERYMSLHERGGLVRKTSIRGRAFTARYPRRAYLEPALEHSRSRILNLFLRRWQRAVATA